MERSSPFDPDRRLRRRTNTLTVETRCARGDRRRGSPGNAFLTGSLHQSVPAVYPVFSTLFLGPIGAGSAANSFPCLRRTRRRKTSRLF